MGVTGLDYRPVHPLCTQQGDFPGEPPVGSTSAIFNGTPGWTSATGGPRDAAWGDRRSSRQIGDLNQHTVASRQIGDKRLTTETAKYAPYQSQTDKLSV